MLAMVLPRLGPALLVMSLLLAACGAPDPTPSPEAATPSPSPRATVTPVPTPARPSDPPTPSPSPSPVPIADDPPALALEEVARVDQPVSIAAAADGFLYVNERRGRVIAIEPTSGMTEVVLDITDRVGSESSEQGLLGFALHPEFRGLNLRAFVHYTDRNGDTVLSEFSVTDVPRPARFDAATERVLLRVDQPFTNHNGGQLAFGPDGHLWFGLGDGGSGGDPLGNGQNRDVLLGKILRLDVDAEPDGDAPYAIPADNPYADATDGAPEVFLSGLRNPWRFSFDRASGALWIADVGQNAFEEVNRVEDPVSQAGANLGWNVMEATSCYAAAGCSSDGLVLPVAQYGRDLGCSVTGGFVYRGAAVEGLAGWYLFSDYCTGLLFGVRSDAPIPAAGERAPLPRILLQTGANVSAFGEDADGELYLADIGSGVIYRIVAAS
jgi:glucose/arabinose dehydrogenase